tara:strand:- start:5338 stop:5901 length:564 start_codon:yes stop_codon:yes gene_type:complete
MKKSFREYLVEQGLKKTSIDNYLSALRDNEKVNYQTAKNWYQKYLGTQSHSPFIQFMIENGMALSTSKAYKSGLSHSNSIHHHRAKKWYDMYIKSTEQTQERVMMKSSTKGNFLVTSSSKGDLTVRSEETYIEPLLNPQNCNANIDSNVVKSTVAKVEQMNTVEIIQAILQMNVTDKNKLDMISSLL